MACGKSAVARNGSLGGLREEWVGKDECVDKKPSFECAKLLHSLCVAKWRMHSVCSEHDVSSTVCMLRRL